MKTFLLESAIVALIALIVLAVKFRSGRAREVLRILRNIGWLYVALVIVLAIVQVAVQ